MHARRSKNLTRTAFRVKIYPIPRKPNWQLLVGPRAYFKQDLQLRKLGWLPHARPEAGTGWVWGRGYPSQVKGVPFPSHGVRGLAPEAVHFLVFLRMKYIATGTEIST